MATARSMIGNVRTTIDQLSDCRSQISNRQTISEVDYLIKELSKYEGAMVAKIPVMQAFSGLRNYDGGYSTHVADTRMDPSFVRPRMDKPPNSMGDFRVFAESRGLKSRSELSSEATRRGLSVDEAVNSVDKMWKHKNNAEVESYVYRVMPAVRKMLQGKSFTKSGMVEAVRLAVENDRLVPPEMDGIVSQRIANILIGQSPEARRQS